MAPALFICLASAAWMASPDATAQGLLSARIPSRPPVAVMRTYTRSGQLVQEIALRSHHYHGKPVRIFAYVVRPRRGRRLPGLVVVHGGGGYAMLSRGIEAARRGFIAVVPDLPGKGPGRARSRSSGPDMTVAQIFNPDPAESYLLHATRAVRACLNHLRSRPDTDPRRMYLWGISWGAVISALVAAADGQLAGCALLYGSGHITEQSIWVGHLRRMKPEDVERWRRIADPATYSDAIGCPVFAITGTNDSCFPLPSFVATWTSQRADRLMLLRPGLDHRIDKTARAAMWKWLVAQAKGRPVHAPAAIIRALPVGDRPGLRVILRGAQLPRRTVLWWTDGQQHWHRSRWRPVRLRPRYGVVVARLPRPAGEVFAFCEATWPDGLTTTSPVYTVTKIKFGDRHRWLAMWGVRQRLHVVPRGWLEAALGLKPRPKTTMTALNFEAAELEPIRRAAQRCNATVRRLKDGALEIVRLSEPPVMAEAIPAVMARPVSASRALFR